MINSINLQNYKSFSDITIPIRPLTILLGANNAGKSSFLQMLLLLLQTNENTSFNYLSALKIYGNYVNAGSYVNLFKDKNTNNPLRITIDFKSEHLLLSIKSLKDNYISDFKDACRYFPIQDLWKLAGEKTNNKKDFTEFVENVLVRLRSYLRLHSTHDFLGRKFTFHDPKFKDDILKIFRSLTGFSEANIANIADAKTLISEVFILLSKLEMIDDSIRVKYEFILKEDKGFSISKIDITTTKGICLISIENKDSSSGNEIVVHSGIVNLYNNKVARDNLSQRFRSNETIFECINVDNIEGNIDSPISLILLRLLRIVKNELVQEFSVNKINYVSPLRAHPKRYYMLDKAKVTYSLDTLDGDAIAEVLVDKKDVINYVNSWFDKFHLKIDVKVLREVIHNLNVTQNNLTLNIADVGFGISQVLPVIVQGFLSMPESITIVEQPEIHLHPQMQADLGDLFLDIVFPEKETNPIKKMIIETHSEYLLRRIRRRISEGRIKSDQVSICVFHSRTEDEDAWVEELKIGEKGDFEWPKEFYGDEIYRDTIEFLKNQK